MSVERPPVAGQADYKHWAERLNSFLTRTKSHLAFYVSGATAYRDGMLVWDDDNKTILYSGNGQWNTIGNGVAGADGTDGTDGTGFTGGSYDSNTGIITFTSNDGLGFSTTDVRGVDGIANYPDVTALYYNGNVKAQATADGVTVTGDVEATEFIGDLRGAVVFKAKAGEALTKGDVVYISGISGNTTVVSKADADDALKMPAFGLAAIDANNNANLEVYTFGTLAGLDTSSYTEGDELFVGTTAGTLVSTAPTGEGSSVQKICKVTRSHASSGSIKIMGAGRTNATPNLNDGNIFIGDSNNQAVTASLATQVSTLETSHDDVLQDGDFTSVGLMKRDATAGSYSIVTDNSGDWNTAHGWGNHADAGYLTSYTETNNLATAVTWDSVPNAYITAGSVTQHQAALTITESQISDLQSYLTSYTETNNLSTAVIWADVPNVNITEGSVTQHQSAINAGVSITESQISNLQSYLTAETSHADVLVDGDFTSNGLMKRDGAGVYSVDSSTYATETYVDTAVSNLVDSAPATLDTLNELASALGDDANFSTTVTNSLSGKANLSGASFTGNVSSTGTISANNFTSTTGFSSQYGGLSSQTGTFTTTSGNITTSTGTVSGATVSATNTVSGSTISGSTFACSGSMGLAGNISVGGTVDGRDVATDGTKLDTIEIDADVTDTVNVTAAGALMDSEVTNLAQVKAFDSSDYATAAQGSSADTAYSWGDHDAVGYLTTFDITTQTDPKYLRADASDTTTGTITAAGLSTSGNVISSGTCQANLLVATGNINATGDMSVLGDYNSLNGSLNLSGGSITLGGTVDGVDIAARDAVLTSTTTTANSALQNFVDDTTPQLGGDLDLNGNDITGTGNISADTFTGGDTVLTQTGILTSDAVLTLRSTDSGNVGAPHLLFDRVSGSPADNDGVGQIVFQGRDSINQNTSYVNIVGKADDVTNATEDGQLQIFARKAGVNTLLFDLTSTRLTLDNDTDLVVDGNISGDYITAGASGISSVGGIYATQSLIYGNALQSAGNTTVGGDLSVSSGNITVGGYVKTDFIEGSQYSQSNLDFYDTATQGGNGTTLKSTAGLSFKYDTNDNDTDGFKVFANGNSTACFTIDDNENITATGNTTVGGNVVVTGTVDGRDVATDGARLDTIPYHRVKHTQLRADNQAYALNTSYNNVGLYDTIVHPATPVECARYLDLDIAIKWYYVSSNTNDLYLQLQMIVPTGGGTVTNMGTATQESVNNPEYNGYSNFAWYYVSGDYTHLFTEFGRINTGTGTSEGIITAWKYDSVNNRTYLMTYDNPGVSFNTGDTFYYSPYAFESAGATLTVIKEIDERYVSGGAQPHSFKFKTSYDDAALSYTLKMKEYTTADSGQVLGTTVTFTDVEEL